MGADWIHTTWGHLVELKYGKGLRDYKNAVGEYPVYGTNGPVGWCKKPLCETPGIIIGRKGAYRGVHYSNKPFYVIDTAYYIVPKVEINIKWAYYYLLLQDINNLDSGSAIPSTSREDFYQLNAIVPPIPIQNEIVNVLDSLNDKITLNREMNKTLEAMAQAIFKNCFVDFEPFKEGEFVESELGMIPKGWETGSIYEAANVIYGAPFASSKFNNEKIGKPLIRIRDLKNESPGVYTPEEHPKGYLVRPGDIVVGMDGEFRAYLWGGEEAWLNQRVCVFAPKEGFSGAFVRMSLIPLLAHIEATETATTVIHLGKGDIDKFRVVLPTEEVLSKFNLALQPIYERIVSNKQEISTLSTLRDTLLPKLLSGEIEV